MRLGVCVDGRGGTPCWRIEALGATAVSVPLVVGYDPPLEAYRERGHDVLLVLGPQALADPTDWRGSIRAALDRADELVRGGLVQQIALGHEPDDGWAGDPQADDPLLAPRGGVGSWVLSASELAELVHRARERLGRRAPLLLGGLVSARPEWLSRLALDELDGLLLHPHADVDIGALLDGVVAEVAAQGLTDRLSLGIGELGRSDHEWRRGAISDWYAGILPQLAARGDVSTCYVCCDSDLTQPGYGVFDAEDRPKPSVASIFHASTLPVPQAPGDPPTGPPEPVESQVESQDDPEDLEDLPWPSALGLTPGELAEALRPVASPIAQSVLSLAIATVWPEAGPHLELYGVADEPAAAIALLATIWVQTDGAFAPRIEEGRYDRCERLYGRGTQLGMVLGNARHGDGHRFRARGLLPIRGRAAYERYGELLGIDLAADPDLAAESAVAMAMACAAFEAAGLWDAARRGDYATIRRAVDPGLNGYGPFLDAVQRLWSALDRRSPPGEPDSERLASAAARALAQVDQPYRPGGAGPGGFDAGGLCSFAYRTDGGEAMPTDPDAIEAWTRPIAPEAARAGDLVLYAYGEPARGGARFAHVALVTERPELVLDSRAGLGVGTRPHIAGAVRRYRRVETGGTTDGEGEQALEAEHLPGADPVPAPRRARRGGAPRAGNRGERGAGPGDGGEPAGGPPGGPGQAHGEVVGELPRRRAGRAKPVG